MAEAFKDQGGAATMNPSRFERWIASNMDMQAGSQSNKPAPSIDPRATKGDSL